MGSRTENGFALVEAIAALAVSAIAAAGLMATLTLAASRIAEIKMREVALRKAEALLAMSLAEPDAARVPGKGTLPDAGLSWIVSLTPPGDPYPGIQQVNVDMTWIAGGKKGATRLAAYRIAPPPAPG
jgi:type II secretory pathway pseudopilin PulG